MATYKTTDEVVDLVYAILNPSISHPIYSHKKRTADKPSTYLVINSLPINASVMQKVHVNVNVHSKNIEDGIPDVATIRPIVKQVVALLEHYTSANKLVLIDIASGGDLVLDDALDEYYYNIRFVVKTINT